MDAIDKKILELLQDNGRMTVKEITQTISLTAPAVSERIKRMEKEVLEEINALGIGPAGLGGSTTAFAVNIETYPTHIAGLPVAVNICCHVNRHIVRTI